MNILKLKKNNNGFTLIELLLVISIIGILSIGLLSVLNPIAQIEKARDAKRKSDLAQLQRILEAYYQDNGAYPDNNGNYQIIGQDNVPKPWGSQWVPYINQLPRDDTREYVYYSPDGQSYYVYASLERGGEDPQACNTEGVVCSSISTNGISEEACDGVCNYGVSSPNVSP